ncbi:MAG: MFS transporter [Janthinobacterium lividum]
MNGKQTLDAPSGGAADAQVIETDLPARLDRLPWGTFHTRVAVALGITWLLDGLEVTLAGAVASALKASPRLHFSNTDVGVGSSAYIAGAVSGALLFGWLTDRLGRRKLFFITLFVYVAATAATACSWDLFSFALFRFFTGAGIGGEYTAVNSTIQEFTPARLRGWTDLAINGTFWIGAGLGAAGSIVLLDQALLPVDVGWRLCFFIGAVLGLGIVLLRRHLPESPRWLITHNRVDDARKVVETLESDFRRGGIVLKDEGLTTLRLHSRSQTTLREVANTLFNVHRQRALVGLMLMTAQAFFYNAIFFTYALVLGEFYGVPADRIGWYLLPFAAGNFAGPLILGRLFDVVGRKPMIAFTYGISGVLLIISGYLFQRGLLDARTQTICWMAIFFFASAAASSAYLTISETFPLEVRALAIAVFYAIGTGLGGVVGPALFGHLIDTHRRGDVFAGYLLGSGLMLLAALVQMIWGVAAERRSLESVAAPLSASKQT